MVIKVHNVFMLQYSVQLDLSVNLAEAKTKCHNCYWRLFLLSSDSEVTTAVPRLPSPVGEVWRRVRVG